MVVSSMGLEENLVVAVPVGEPIVFNLSVEQASVIWFEYLRIK